MKTSYLCKMKNNFVDGIKSVLFGSCFLRNVLSYWSADCSINWSFHWKRGL